MPDRSVGSRRRFLHLVGAGTAVGVAGCGGQQETETPAGGPGAETGTPDLSGPVPQQYVNATSIGGIERDPARLDDKEEVSYQSQPNQGNRCSGCVFYITDMDGDGLGACSEVEGFIEPEGWCTDFSPTQDGGS